MQTTTETESHVHEHDEHHDHHELPFWQKYVFSTDHKVIGIQYLITSLVFLLIGFMLVGAMRWQLAYPGKAIPIVGGLMAKAFNPSEEGKESYGLTDMVGMEEGTQKIGVMSADLYNTFGAMHGTIMVFLAIVPLGFAAFGNYVMPLQIGAPDMTFPKLNMASYWVFLLGGLLMFYSLFIDGGAAKSGWTSYSPLASVTDRQIPINGQTYWLVGMVLLITSSLLGAVNFIATTIQLRTKGMSWMRMPFFSWAIFVTAFLLLLAFPPLEAAGIMQLMDNVAGTSFFLPSGLVVDGNPLGVSGGGSPLLWQHLFWFLGHPEVYVLILPALGIVAEVIANNTRKPIWGYRTMVYAALILGFLSFIVWAHHMYLTGMGTKIATFFQTTTMMISIPSVIILTCLFISLWGGRIRFNTQMLFVLAFLVMFGIGGLTGLPLGFAASDIALHDSYYVIAHFHYVVAPGTIFALFAGIYHWFPKVTGRFMNERLGRIHFAGSFIFMNGVFFPMFIQGMEGMSRRMYDGGATYLATEEVQGLSQLVINLNENITHAALFLGIFQLPFIFNFFWSIWKGRKVENDNPWNCTTLDWATPTPPPHGNFLKQPVVYRGPYEYSVPHGDQDFSPQSEPDRA